MPRKAQGARSAIAFAFSLNARMPKLRSMPTSYYPTIIADFGGKSTGVSHLSPCTVLDGFPSLNLIEPIRKSLTLAQITDDCSNRKRSFGSDLGVDRNRGENFNLDSHGDSLDERDFVGVGIFDGFGFHHLGFGHMSGHPVFGVGLGLLN